MYIYIYILLHNTVKIRMKKCLTKPVQLQFTWEQVSLKKFRDV